MSDKTILEQWRAIAYDQQADRNKLQQFWAKYFNIEKNIYAQLLENPDEVVTGTVKELAEKYQEQLRYYAKALEQMSGKKVKEKIIYSFTLKKEIYIE